MGVHQTIWYSLSVIRFTTQRLYLEVTCITSRGKKFKDNRLISKVHWWHGKSFISVCKTL